MSAAAEQIYPSQPTVSLQIQALECELGTLLFERRSPKIRLTDAGGRAAGQWEDAVLG